MKAIKLRIGCFSSSVFNERVSRRNWQKLDEKWSQCWVRLNSFVSCLISKFSILSDSGRNINSNNTIIIKQHY